MIRCVLRLTTVMVLSWAAVVLLALALGSTLSAADELLVTAVIGDNDLDMYRLSLVRHIAVPVTENTFDDFQGSWSPDGQHIVFVSNRGGSSAIYTMDAQGKSVRRLTEGQIGDYSPSWSPDGQHIVFTSDRYPTSREILLYNLNDGSTRRLTDDSNLDNNPTWSPDSNHIIYSSIQSGSQKLHNLYDLNLISGEITPFDLPLDSNLAPAWSPDGRYILYHVLDGDTGLYVWDIGQARSIKVFPSISFLGSVIDWSPDSRSIIYADFISQNASGIFRIDIMTCLQNPTACKPELQIATPNRYLNPRWRPHQP